MGQAPSTEDRPSDGDEALARAPSGSQTLFRGLDVLDVVADGPIGLPELAQRLELTRSTTHRLAAALVERRYLTFVPREGYSLGPKLLELGYEARQQIDVARVARPFLEKLAARSEDTVHLGVLDADSALYLDKIPGRRRVQIGSRVGDRHPLTSTGLGKALILEQGDESLARFFAAESTGRRRKETLQSWLGRMREYAKLGHAFDLEENEDQIRCVAAPVRGVDGRIIAAISVSSAAQYMDGARMAVLANDVQQIARDISIELGWTAPPRAAEPKPAKKAARPTVPVKKPVGGKKPARG
ncbi:MAG: transcriptional regulator [Rhodospirillales bacterium]|nr:transcriptional regulator [Rhodospirillales bacterium]